MSLKEYFLTDSNKSIMRLTFFITTITGLALAAVSVGIALWVGATQQRALEIGAVVTIIGLLLGSGFAGKATQSFGEALESKAKEKADKQDTP